MGGCGAALTEDIYSAYYNPAALTGLYSRTHTRLNAAYFAQNLLPELEIKDLYQRVIAFAVNPPWRFRNLTFGAAYYNNHVSQGQMEFKDETGEISPFVFSHYDNIHHIAFGAGFRDFIRAGMAAKILSMHSLEDSWGMAFDAGLQLSYPFCPGFIPVVVEPGGGIVYRNAGFNPRYGDSETELPLPGQLCGGAAVRLDLMEYIGITGAIDRSDKLTYGMEIRITPFYSMQYGRLDYDTGQQSEKTWGFSLIIDFKRAMAFFHRIKHGDYDPESEDIRKIYSPDPSSGVISLSGNFRIGFHYNYILPDESGDSPRNNQARLDMIIGL
jgi:hypothetical protein